MSLRLSVKLKFILAAISSTCVQSQINKAIPIRPRIQLEVHISVNRDRFGNKVTFQKQTQ